jgi:ABC-2 type transport system permease protein
MSSLYGKTLYQKRYMALGWFVGIAFVTFLTMSVYNSFSDGEIARSLEQLPPALQKIAGDAASFKSVGGFISQQIFALRVPLLLTILSIAIMVSLTAGEEERGLTETQLALPIGRGSLVLQKLAAGLSVIVLASLGALLGVQLGLLTVGQSYSLLNVLPLLLNCALVAIGYGLVAFAVGAATGRRGLALGAASGLAFLGFLINSMAGSVAFLEKLDPLTLFHYYSKDAANFDWSNLGLLSGICLILIVVGTLVFRSRDIRAR